MNLVADKDLQEKIDKLAKLGEDWKKITHPDIQALIHELESIFDFSAVKKNSDGNK